MKYSKSTNGFYDPEINTTIPDDAVEITVEKWQSLMTAQANGQMIKADKAGNPVAVDHPDPTGQELITLCFDHISLFVKIGGQHPAIFSPSFCDSRIF